MNMNKTTRTAILATAAFCVCAPAHASLPEIKSPQDAEGVLMRVIENVSQGLKTSARPKMNPRRDGIEAVSDTPTISLGADDLTPFDETLLSKGKFALSSENVGARFLGYSELPNREDVVYALSYQPEVLSPAESAIPISSPESVRLSMADIIRNQLSTSYDLEVIDGESGYERLLSLAENNGVARSPSTISSEAYESDEPELVPQQAAFMSPQMNIQAPSQTFSGNIMGMDPAAAMLNTLSGDHLARLSPEQITALVMAAQGRPMDIQAMRAASQQAQPSVQQIAQATTPVMNGIPSLDYRGDDLPTPQVISAADVPTGSMPFEASTNSFLPADPVAPAPVEVGDGQNLLLKGWSLGLTGTGEIGMYMVGDPGSIIEISEGMVVGPLGAVKSLTMENGNIIAKFSSGEEMVSPAALVSMTSL